MLANTITTSYNGNILTLTKVREGNFSSEYSGIVDVSLERARCYINHTIPKRGESGESHLVKVAIEHVDANGAYFRTTQSHNVIKTLDAVQGVAATKATQATLVDVISSVFTDQVINGES